VNEVYLCVCRVSSECWTTTCISDLSAGARRRSRRQLEEVDAELVLQRATGEVEAGIRQVPPDREARRAAAADVVTMEPRRRRVLLLVLPGAVLGRVELVCRLGIAAEHVHVRRHRLAADHISAAGPGAVAVAGAVAARVGAIRRRCVGDHVHAAVVAEVVVGPGERVRGAVGALLHCRDVGHGKWVEADGRGVWRERVVAAGGVHSGETVVVG